jgi:hypothetical protein
MSLDTIATSYFGCAETPVWFPNDVGADRVPDCKSCKLRLVSPVPGPGTVSPRAEGLLVDENPLSTLSVNGIQHNLVETLLMIGGAHRLPGRSEVCKAELACYFQSTRDFSQHVCLSLPIDIGTGAANQYFATLGGATSGRPVLSKIVPPKATYMLYRGADLRGRSARNNVPSKFCDPVKRVTAYYVCLTPIFITNADYTRLVGRAGKELVGPAKPLTPVVVSRLTMLASRVDGITIGAPAPLGPGGTQRPEGPGYPTKALKCYRVDPARDIRDNKVYIGGVGAPTDLKKELAVEDDSGGIFPGDLQRWIADWLGLLLSIILAAFAFVAIFSSIFKNYKEAQTLYDLNPFGAYGITAKVLSKESGTGEEKATA